MKVNRAADQLVNVDNLTLSFDQKLELIINDWEERYEEGGAGNELPRLTEKYH
jgi:hypothetical protein